MADSRTETSPGEESPAQKQARIRRERREAKIKAGGSARLEKIAGLAGGRPAESAPPPRAPLPSFSPPSTSASTSNDPEEVDITNHPFTSRRPVDANNPQNPFQNAAPADMRQIFGPMGDTNPFAIPGGPSLQQQQQQGGSGGGMGGPEGEDDPMMRVIQQMMSGMPGGPGQGGIGGGPGGGEGLPPGLAAMFGGGAGGPDGQGEVQQEDTYGYIWKILHAVFALALGLYIVFTTPFSGSHLLRTESLLPTSTVPDVRFFWVFATAELVLQSARYFLERGKVGGGGMMAMISGFLPEPWKGYLLLVARYSGIYNTVVEDAMVVIFVLGVVAWWNG
ncbi:MAG: hypothetical protein MMC33_002200 [Icmadophila ericetorum]|nr:hypothetical protein [Icmadophila ericetorum]